MDIKTQELEELKAARSSKREQDLRLLAFLQKIFLLLKSPSSSEILLKAVGRINLWREQNLCSDYFISAWTSILSSRELVEFEKRILDPNSKESLALIQKSPLSFLMRDVK